MESLEVEKPQKEIEYATDSLQALERLFLSTAKRSDSKENDTLKDKVRTTRDHLREIKALVEGRHDDFVPLDINNDSLLELKQLLLMHVPSSITADTKQKFANLISDSLKGRCKKVLAGILLTCPWYAATQKERGEQARFNKLLVVVVAPDRHFFSPANPQTKEAGGLVNLGSWLSVIELYHFAHLLMLGRTRYVEAVFCDDASLVYTSQDWTNLRKTISPSLITGLRPFLEACCGQAMGSLTKKRKNGGLKLRDNIDIMEICEAFRLLSLAHGHHEDRWSFNSEVDSSSLPDVAKLALEKCKALYKQDPDVPKQDIFQCLMSWNNELRCKTKTCTFSNQKEVAAMVGQWLMDTRLDGRTLIRPAVLEDSHSKLVHLITEIGGPLQNLAPEQILLLAKAGSHMYGLSTADSDADYVVIYAEPTEKLLRACSRSAECFENRGPNKEVEYGMYEARLLCDMLLKGSVVILELVYLANHEYISPHWQRLHDNRDKFVTELAIQQYLGLIKNNIVNLNNEKLKGSNVSRERKLFYQIFHKMSGICDMMTGVAPNVRVTGPLRDFILDVRTQPLEGELSRERLLCKVKKENEDLRYQLAHRKHRLSENPDFKFVTDWLLEVRGDIFL